MSAPSPPSAPLLPPIDDESRPFFEAAARGELAIPRCAVSGRFVFPPRAMSPFAPGAPLEWVRVSGRGTLWSFVVPHPPLLPWYAGRAPYAVAAVALDEDPRVRLVGALVAREGGPLGEVDPATLRIGAHLRVCFERVADGIALPRWLLAE
jgi:uncharacterized OB-fold protein